MGEKRDKREKNETVKFAEEKSVGRLVIQRLGKKRPGPKRKPFDVGRVEGRSAHRKKNFFSNAKSAGSL